MNPKFKDQSMSFGLFNSDVNIRSFISPMKSPGILSPFYNRQDFHQMLKSPQGQFQLPNGTGQFAQVLIYCDLQCQFQGEIFQDQRCFEDLPLGAMFENTQPSSDQNYSFNYKEGGSPQSNSNMSHVIAVKRSNFRNSNGFKMEQVRFQQQPGPKGFMSPQMRFHTPQAKLLGGERTQFLSDKVLEKRRTNFEQQQVQPCRLYSSQEEVEVEMSMKGRSQKGRLRYLSLKVKDIVCDLKETTYKEVADKLIQQFQQPRSQEHLQTSAKDEQNIKRRVYDALNVMIASGVLRKENKKVLSDWHTFRGKSKKDYKLQEHQQIKKKVLKLRTTLHIKRVQLTEQFNSVVCLQALQERNKSMKDDGTSKKIYLPLLLFQEDVETTNFKMVEGRCLIINSQRKVCLESGMLALQQMSFNTNNRDKHALFAQLEPFLVLENSGEHLGSPQF